MVKRGYFNKKFGYYGIVALKKIMPNLSNKQIYNRAGISSSTYYRLLKTEAKHTSIKTLKKITHTLNSGLTTENQILFARVSVHIKRYGGISEKFLKKYRRDAKRERNRFMNIDNKEYLFFRIIYGRTKK